MSYDSCQTCGDCHTSLILNKDGRCRACIAEEKIVRLENQLASGVHTCTDTCQRPMCVLRRRVEANDMALVAARHILTGCDEQGQASTYSRAMAALSVINEALGEG